MDERYLKQPLSFGFVNNPHKKIHDDYGLYIAHFFAKRPGKQPLRIRPRSFEYFCVTHLIDGDGIYWEPGKQPRVLKPGQLIVMEPDFVHCYGSYMKKFVEDGVCFSGPIANHLQRAGIIKRGVYDCGTSRILKPILDLVCRPTIDDQIQANSRLQELLVKLYFERKKGASVDSPLSRLIDEVNKNPERWWTTAEMADYCNLCLDHFRRLFKKETGVNPKLYLDQVKLRQAADDIIKQGLSVSEVAEKYGYANPFHFSKRFKAVMGTSPSTLKI